MKYTPIIVSCCIITFCIGGYSFANGYDCNIAKGNGLYKFASKTDIDGPFGKTEIDLAVQHLADFCNKIPGNTISENTSQGAESPYLFDQLLDLSFRKLDANIDPSLRYGLKPDVTGVKRQDIVTKFASQFSTTDGGKQPTTENTLGKFIVDFSTYWPVDGISAEINYDDCTTANYNTLQLYEKYYASCEIARCISDHTFVVTNTTDSHTETSNTALINCDDIASNRFITEAAYTKQAVTRVGIRAITSSLSSYSENYFIGNRRQTLFDKMTLFDQAITFVNHKVQEGTRSCSK